MKNVQITLSESEKQDSSVIERSLTLLSGIKNIQVDLSTMAISAECEDYIGEDQIISTLRQAGYQVADISFTASRISFLPP